MMIIDEDDDPIPGLDAEACVQINIRDGVVKLIPKSGRRINPNHDLILRFWFPILANMYSMYSM